jgi:hypothetical protein
MGSMKQGMMSAAGSWREPFGRPVEMEAFGLNTVVTAM